MMHTVYALDSIFIMLQIILKKMSQPFIRTRTDTYIIMENTRIVKVWHCD